VAGGPGFEPRLTESESAVLPLNYPPPAPRKSLEKKDFEMPKRAARAPRLCSCDFGTRLINQGQAIAERRQYLPNEFKGLKSVGR
jgi:hypothetical protein